MATVIFKWNPAFSDFDMSDFLTSITDAKFSGFDEDDCDSSWAVWDYERVHKGDRYFMVKVGFGQTGIVGWGDVTSEPYEGEDWSGKGRKTYYVKFCPSWILNPDALPLLTCDELAAAIPDFEWHKGHSGLMLTPDQEKKLDKLWEEYTASHDEEFTEKAAEDNDYIFIKDTYALDEDWMLDDDEEDWFEEDDD